jgi:hypothetical protein
MARNLLVDHQSTDNDGDTGKCALCDCVVLLVEVGDESGAVMSAIRLYVGIVIIDCNQNMPMTCAPVANMNLGINQKNPQSMECNVLLAAFIL